MLKPTGVYAVYNFFRQGWIAARIRDQLRAAFDGADPIGMTTHVKEAPLDFIPLNEFSPFGFTLFFAGKPEVLEPIRAAFSRPEIRYWYPWKTGVDLDTKARFSSIAPAEPPPPGAHKIFDPQGKEEPPLVRTADRAVEETGMRQAPMTGRSVFAAGDPGPTAGGPDSHPSVILWLSRGTRRHVRVGCARVGTMGAEFLPRRGSCWSRRRPW